MIVAGLAVYLDRAVAGRVDRLRLRLLGPVRRRAEDEALRIQLSVLDVMRSRVPIEATSGIDAQRVHAAWLIGEKRTRA